MEPDESTQTLMSDDVLTVRRQGPLAMVRFTQPKTPNAINLRLAVVLTETLRGLAGDPVIRGVVLPMCS